VALASAIASVAHAVPARQLSDQAHSAAVRGNWNDAAHAFEELVAGGVDASEVLYDLGTAYAHAGRYGEAIWRLEQVVRRSAFATDAQQNLRAARLLLAHRDAARSGRAVVETAMPFGTSLAELLPLDWAIGLTLALEVAALACLVSWRRRRGASETSNVARIAGTALFAGAALVAGSIVFAAAAAPDGAIVLHDGLHLLRDPAADAIGDASAREGERVEVLAHRGTFTRVHTYSGASGWLATRDLGSLAE
jgi:hypothetical protein